ncbi:MCE family protein [Sphingobacteriales bacterium UPWRP_1]|nr:hypothetical protein B6N25_06115 [Sphingobacteriales bacterium TSM_CSS]PSJ78648.1 MCE family protein [Sphingobacteriales bacterium UPWRP_1]
MCTLSIKISNETKVGALTLAAIITLVLGYNYLKGKNLFRQQIVYYAVYERVDGLLPANPVLVNGLQIGIVDKIYLKEDDPAKVVVRFSLKEIIDIPKGSTLQIVSSSLLGDKALELKMPQVQTAEDLAKVVYVTPGDTLEGLREQGITEMALKEIEPIKTKAEHLLQTLDSTMAAVNKIIRSDKMDKIMNEVAQSITAVKNSLTDVQILLANMSEFSENDLGKVSNILQNVEDLSKTISSNSSKINNIVANAETLTGNLNTLSGNLSKTDIAATMQKANATLDELSQITAKIKSGEGSVAMLLNNPSLYKNLEQSSLDLDRLLVDLRQNPKNYLGFSLITINRQKKNAAPPPTTGQEPKEQDKKSEKF